MAPDGFSVAANKGSSTGGIASWRGPGGGRAGQGRRAGDIEAQVSLRAGDCNPCRIETLLHVGQRAAIDRQVISGSSPGAAEELNGAVCQGRDGNGPLGIFERQRMLRNGLAEYLDRAGNVVAVTDGEHQIHAPGVACRPVGDHTLPNLLIRDRDHGEDKASLMPLSSKENRHESAQKCARKSKIRSLRALSPTSSTITASNALARESLSLCNAYSDLVSRVCCGDGALNIYLLFEHKSSPQHWAQLHLLRYIALEA